MCHLIRTLTGVTTMILAATAMGEAASRGSTAAASAAPLRVSVLLGNYAGLGPEVVERGKAIAERIYRAAGIELVWFGGRELAWKLPQDRKARDTFYQSTLKVHVLAHRQLPAGVLAGAVREARTAWVSMEHLDREARKHPRVSLSHILGYVIAHEIGHLLGQGHCGLGLMAARLDWHRASQGGLWFAGRQAADIREQVSTDASLAPPAPAPDLVVLRSTDTDCPTCRPSRQVSGASRVVTVELPSPATRR